MKILLVEGNKGDVLLIEGRGAQAAEAVAVALPQVRSASAPAAIACVGSEHPDVVVVASDDLDLLSLLVTSAPHVPVLVLSASADPAFAREALGRGAQDCIARSDAGAGKLARALDFAVVRKRVERAQLKNAQDETRSRDEVIAIIAHDLRNPLNVMTMTMALLGEDHSITEEKRDKHMKKLERATARMVALIDELLDISRMDANRLMIEAEVHKASIAVGEALEATLPIAAEKSVCVESLVPQELQVYADAPRIAQIFTILVIQAVAMAPKGGVVRISAEHDEEGVRFTVNADGATLPAEQLPRVYDRYWSKKHGSREGTGLGLTIAKGLVEAHGGNISAASNATGTSFTFTLPPQKPDDKPQGR